MSKICLILEKKAVLYIFFPLSFIYLFLFFNQGINIYDEGLAVYGALRVLHGDVPYKDFWAIYSPGQFYVLAGVFKLFGVLLIVARIWSTLIKFALLMCTYFVARKLVPQKFALAAWFLMLIWLGSFQFHGSPIIPSLMFALLGALNLLNFLQKQHRVWLFMSGIFAGIAVLFRYDIGSYLFLVTILVIALFCFVARSEKGAKNSKKLLHIVKMEAFYVFGLALVLLPVFSFFFLVVPIHDLVFDFVQFPFKIYPNVRALPFPSPLPNLGLLLSGDISPLQYVILAIHRLPFYAPLVIYTLIIIIFLARISQSTIDWCRNKIWGVAFILFLGIMFFNHVRVRSDQSHLMATYVPAVVMFATFLFAISGIKKHHMLAWSFAFLLGFSFIGSSLYKSRHMLLYGLLSPNKLSFTLDRAKGIYGNKDWVISYQEALMYIKKNVPKGERIFVGRDRHDHVFNNDIMFYFLSDRHSATKFHELHPGITTTTVVQERIIDDMKMWEVEYIVLQNDDMKKEKLKETKRGSRTLDNFIEENFKIDRKFGNYTIWKKQDKK